MAGEPSAEVGTGDPQAGMTIDERLEKLAERHEALTETVELLAQRSVAAEERHDREMDEIRQEARATHADLRRAFELGVREARNERRRRQELAAELKILVDRIAAAQLITEEKLTALTSAQAVTEETLQRFIESLRRGGNGNPG
jgi:DNA repair exonuclease SbcCD ATPase subunit